MAEKRIKMFLYEHEKSRQEKRRLIADRLAEGKTYRQIQNELGVSSATISAVKKMSSKKKGRTWNI